MKGWTTLKKVLRGQIPPRYLWYRMLQALGSRSARLNCIYTDSPDPWFYESNPYEKTKYENTLQALPRPRYARALEIACSIGVFTDLLAARADRVVGMDLSREAARIARKRCAAHDNVTIQVDDVLQFQSEAKFDLITCAEMLHYVWEAPDQRARLFDALRDLLAPQGHLVVVSGVEHFPFAYEEAFQKAGFPLLNTQSFDATRPYRISVFSQK